VNQAPPLYFLDYNAPVFLHTDASDFGIGANLYQVRDTKEVPIAFISKALTTSEVKWSTPEKECYAIFYALVKLVPPPGYTLHIANRSSQSYLPE
jgi:hypothetical protein